MSRQQAPADFSAELKRCMEETDTATRTAGFCALAKTELGYVQSIQFDRAVGLAEADPGMPGSRLALLSSSTVDHLQPALTLAGFRCGIRIESHLTPYGQYRQELLNPASELRDFEPDTLLFAISARNVLATVDIAMGRDEVARVLDQAVDDLRQLWASALSIPRSMVIQQTFLNATEPLFGSLDRTFAAAPSNVVQALNDRLASATEADGVTLLDLDHAVRKDGLAHWYDHAKWLQAKIEIPPAAAIDYADRVARLVAASKGLAKKCLVLDLDNTLWGGVVGDDGIDNLVLGEGSGTGEAFLALQRYAKQLKERGIVLAVCSKNEQDVAESVFRNHPEMILSLDDIACFVANWDDKATNLKRIAERLNIGIDSLVFVDDNPAERGLVRCMLPEVTVPELPEDPAAYVHCVANGGHFESLSFTPEDRQRSEQYAANARRESLLSSAQSLDDYLASLEMHMTAGPFTELDLPRVAQLINKTNQFNTTTLRRNLDEVRDIAADDRSTTVQVRLADRFGDNGLVSALIVRPDPLRDDALTLDSWVMSCRVFGRQLDRAIMNYLVDELLGQGESELFANFQPTAKNRIIENLFSDLGFEPVADSDASGSGQLAWRLILDDYAATTTQIATNETDSD